VFEIKKNDKKRKLEIDWLCVRESKQFKIHVRQENESFLAFKTEPKISLIIYFDLNLFQDSDF